MADSMKGWCDSSVNGDMNVTLNEHIDLANSEHWQPATAAKTEKVGPDTCKAEAKRCNHKWQLLHLEHCTAQETAASLEKGSQT